MTYFSAPGITERKQGIDYIQKVICDYFHIPSSDIQKNTRNRECTLPRQIVHYFAKKYTIKSLSSIGKEIGDKDHATVLHSCKTVNNLIDTDKQFRAQIEEIERRIKA
jgi:chromosomal replication initiator protein